MKHLSLSLLVGFISVLSQAQTTYYANSSTGNDSNNGLSPSTAKRSFTAAYNAASSGDTVALSGTFDWTDAQETGDAAITGFSLLKALTIVGDGAGLTFIQSAPTPRTADRCVFTIDHDITLEHLTIRNGFNTNQAENAGGITVLDQNRDNIVTLNNCIIENNEIENGTTSVTTYFYFAGGIYLRGNTSFHPDLRLNDCIIRNNSATGRAYGAGGLYSKQNNDLTINRCTFNNNSSTDGSAFGVGYHNVAGGMGFYRFNTVHVTNSTFTANNSETSGGAILSYYNQTVLTNNTIAYNSVSSASGKGGGVYVVYMQQSPGNLYLKNNIIAQNTVNGGPADIDFNNSWASNIIDNGSNIIETYAGSSITPSGTGTITGTQANLNLSSSLALNGATNGVLTLALSAGSVAIDAGFTGSNGSVTVPGNDQRGFFNNGAKDIGAFEFNALTTPATYSTDIQTACDSYTWIDGNTYTSDNDTATFTLTNAAGFDSIVTLDLTILASTTGTDIQTACDSYTWINGVTYTSSNNTATDTLTNGVGCDSIVTLNLTINNSITETILPMITCVDTTVYVSAAGTVSIDTSDIVTSTWDNCTIDSVWLSHTSATCANDSINVTAYIQDGGGNIDSAIAVVYLIDTFAPIILTHDTTLYLDATGNIVFDTSAVLTSITENCTLDSVWMSATTASCANDSVNVTVYAVDLSGNMDSATATVTVLDTINPTIACVDTTVYLDSNGLAYLDTSMVQNGFADNCGVESVWSPSFTTSSFGQPSKAGYSYANFSATTYVGQTFEVQSDIKVSSIEVNFTLVATGSFNMVVYSDSGHVAIDSSVIIVSSIGDKKFNFSNLNLTSGRYSWVIKPQNSGTSRVKVVARLNNNTRLFKRFSNGNPDDYASYTLPNPLDAYYLIHYPNPTYTCSNSNEQVTVYVRDNSGNIDSCVANVTVRDSIVPNIAVQNATVYVSAAGTVSFDTSDIVTSTWDNCTVDSVWLSHTSATCANNSIEVTAYIQDGSGNIDSAMARVYVLDTLLPILVAHDTTLYLDATGNVAFDTSAVLTSVTENCTLDSVWMSATSATCGNDSVNVTVYAVDLSGNVDSASATITVLDTINPTISCVDTTFYIDSLGVARVPVISLQNGYADNCGVDSVWTNLGSFLTTAIDTTYFFSQSSGVYSNLTGAISLNNGNTWDDPEYEIPLGFNFNFYGNTLDSLIITGYGYGAELGLTSNQITPVIVPLGVDLIDRGSENGLSLSPISYKTTGVVGNRITKIEWKNAGFYNGDKDDDDVYEDYVNLQLWIYENGNKIEFHYGPTVINDFNASYDGENGPWGVGISSLFDFDGYDYKGKSQILSGNPLSPTLEFLDDGDGLAYMSGIIPNGTIYRFTPISLSDTLLFSCGQSSPIPLYIRDNFGNMDSCVANVTVLDTIAPAVTVTDTMVYLAANGQFDFDTSFVVTSTWDNCKVDSVWMNVDSALCSDVNGTTGFINVTTTIRDGSGNTSSATSRVVVLDTISPIVNAANDTVYLNAMGTASTSLSIIENGSTDNCGIATIALSDSAFSCANIGMNTVTVTVTDNSGNVSSADATVLVVDSVNPVVVCQPTTAYLDATGNAIISASDINNGSYDNCNNITLSASQTAFTCADLGVNSVTLTVTDANGNVDSCVTTVTVIDLTPPVASCRPDTIYLNASGVATLAASDIDNGSSDNCSVSLSLSQTTFNCSSIGANTVTLTVRDAQGLTSTCTTTVTVLDTLAPVMSCQSVTVNLDGSGVATITAADINSTSADNCGMTMSLSKTTFDCTNIGTNTVTLIGTDASGNLDSCTALVTVVDATTPTVICKSATIYLDNSGNATLTIADVDNGSRDNCGMTLSLSNTAFTCADLGTNTVTLIGTDGNGNSDTCTATVTVVDNTPPLIPPYLSGGAFDIYLDSTGKALILPYSFALGTSGLIGPAFDNCDSLSITISKNYVYCSDIGIDTMVITATDFSGNTTVGLVAFDIQDTLSPVMNCQPVTVNLDALGVATITTMDVDNGSTDNCDFTLSLSQTTFTCADLGTNMVTLTGTDASGNTSTCMAVVTVVDAINPIALCKPATIYLDTNGEARLVASDIDNGSSDICGVTLSITDTLFTCSDAGANNVTLSATDAAGNTSTCVAVVTVLDTIAPVAICKADTLYLNATGTASLTAAMINDGSSDNCTFTMSVSQSTYTCTDLGTSMAMLTVTDASGNTSTCTSTITVMDTLAPMMSCAPATIYLDALGMATLTASQVDGGSSDNCGIVTMSVSRSTFTCADMGTTTVTLTGIDASGNRSTCTSVVTIMDTLAPVVLCKSTTIALDATGNATITTLDVDNGSSDNCGITLSLSNSTFNCTQVGVNTVTLTGVDASGNTASCTATVTVVDNLAPTAVCQNITISLDANGQATIVASDVDGGSFDNCAVSSVDVDKTDFDCSNVGRNQVTLTVTDLYGNVSSCVATVTVEDNVAPIVLCPADKNRTVRNTTCTYVVEDFAWESSNTDNCIVNGTTTEQFPAAGTEVSAVNGRVTITIVTTDASMNADSCTFDVIVNCEQELDIPQFISPNGDGKNDFWDLAELGNYPQNVVKIFNRYGTLVFEQRGYTNEFIGKSNVDNMARKAMGNGMLPNGTYFYVIDLGTNTVDKKVYNGYVQINK